MGFKNIPLLRIDYGKSGKHNRVFLDELEVSGSTRKLSELLSMPSLPHMLPLKKQQGKRILYEQWIRLDGERLLDISNVFPPIRYKSKEEIYRLGITRWRLDLTVYSKGDLSSGELNRSKGHINNNSIEVFQVLSGEVRMYLQNPQDSSKAYYADLKKSDLLMIPPGWWHTTHVIEGPSAVINLVNREGFLDWREKRYGNQFSGGLGCAYTFARSGDKIIAVKNPEYKKIPKLIKIISSNIPVINQFSNSLQTFCFLAPDELLEKFEFDILSANQKSNFIIPQSDYKKRIIKNYYPPLYGSRENLATRSELKILNIAPPYSTETPYDYTEVLTKLKRLNKNEKQLIIENLDLSVIRETVKLNIMHAKDRKLKKTYELETEHIRKRSYKIILSLNSGGGVAHTYLVTKNNQLFVIKYCDWVGVENNGLGWLHKQALCMEWMKPYLGEAILKVYEIVNEKKFTFYVMEYRRFKTFSNILINNSFEEFYTHFDSLINYLCKNLYSIRKGEIGWIKADKTYVKDAYFERSRRRLSIIATKTATVNRTWRRPANRLAGIFKLLLKAKYIRINGVTYKNIPEILDVLETKETLFKPGHLVNLIHGDAYLGNIGIDSKGQIVLFDIRGRLPSSFLDPIYDFGKMAHSFMWDLVRSTKSITSILNNIKFESNGKAAIIKLECDISKTDIINKIFLARRHFFKSLPQNHDFIQFVRELNEGVEKSMTRVTMAEWVNLVSDIPNRVEDDESGNMELAMYALGTILANEQMESLNLRETTNVKLEDIILRPLNQEIFRQNKKIINTYSNLITKHGVCGLIMQSLGQKHTLLEKLTQNFKVLEITTNQLLDTTKDPSYLKLRNLIEKTEKAPYSTILKFNDLSKAPFNNQLFDIILNLTNKKKIITLVTVDLKGFSLLEIHAPSLIEKVPWVLTMPILPPAIKRNKCNVVVIGASGFLGRAIYTKFKSEGFDVTGTCFTHNILPEFELIDVTSKKSISNFLKKLNPQPKIIIYAGGLLADKAEYDSKSSFILNVEAIKTIRCYSNAKLIFFSSDQVFGTAEKPPYYSYSIRYPLTVYGRHKADAENLVLSDHSMIAIRAGALYGFNSFEDKNTFPTETLSKLIRNEKFYVDEKRNIFPFPIEEAAETVFKLAFSNWSGICAINGNKTTYWEWSNILRKVFKVGKPGQIMVGDMKKQTIRPLNARMISIDTPSDLVPGTIELQKKLIESLDNYINYNLVPAPIDIDDAKFFSETVDELAKAGVKEVELDAMDGEFTPARVDVIERLRFLKINYPNIRVRVHLMVKNPLQDYIQIYGSAGANIISIHVSSFQKSHKIQRLPLIRAIRKIRAYQAEPVLIISVGESINMDIKDIILKEKIHEVIIMGVTPGIRGESFNPHALDLVRELKTFAINKKVSLKIGVDGGLRSDILEPAAKAGASIFISWSMLSKNLNGLIGGFEEVKSKLDKINLLKDNSNTYIQTILSQRMRKSIDLL